MTTQLEDHGTHYVVSTIMTVGRERRRPRKHVQVPKGDPAALKAEIERQVAAAHLRAGIETPKERLVV